LNDFAMAILIVGRSHSGIINALDNRGEDYVILRDIKGANLTKSIKNRVLCDFSSKKQILETVDGISTDITAVISIYENYILPAAWITEHLGLPGMPIEAAEACTDKELMREAFAKAPEKISPDFTVVKDEADVRAFAEAHTFPLILKPASLAKSLLVTKSNDLDELLANYQKTMQLIDDVYAKYGGNREPKLILEEFLEGTIHSVDAFVDETGEPHVLDCVVDYLTGYDIGFADNFHYARLLPSKLSPQQQSDLRHVATIGCKALGMKSSPAHVEIIMTPEGPRIVEIGARNGGYRERMHKMANGIDIMAASLDLRYGKKPNITKQTDFPCAVLELFPKSPGIFSEISQQELLEQLPSLQSFTIKQKIGDFVGSSSDGYKMCAIIILCNKDVEQFNKDLDFVNKNVSVVTSN
jgi:hypothetical protein